MAHVHICAFLMESGEGVEGVGWDESILFDLFATGWQSMDPSRCTWKEEPLEYLRHTLKNRLDIYS